MELTVKTVMQGFVNGNKMSNLVNLRSNPVFYNPNYQPKKSVKFVVPFRLSNNHPQFP